jgi:ubiquinone/menaquinone biosynthesis C-methylase UbiE
LAHRGRAEQETIVRQQQPWEHWQLEGSSAEAYERYLVPILFVPWANRLIELADPQPGARVLDIACGTGIVARRVAPHVGAGGVVVGLDINPGMLAVARAASAQSRPAIEWREGDAAALPFADTSFDVVFCQQALQFFPDPCAVLSEMRRVLAPGGRLAFNVCRSTRHNPLYGTHADNLARYAGAQVGVMMRSPFPDWTVDDLRRMVTASGLRDAEITIGVQGLRYPSPEGFLWYEGASSPLAEVITSMPDETRAALIRDVSASLAPHTDDQGVSFPIEAYFVTAHRPS